MKQNYLLTEVGVSLTKECGCGKFYGGSISFDETCTLNAQYGLNHILSLNRADDVHNKRTHETVETLRIEGGILQIIK